MSGHLTLVPTPLKDDLALEPQALALLGQAALNEETLLLVEELKVARIRWLKWGLPREAIARFIAFNEHTHAGLEKDIIHQLKQGRAALLMSDGGLPAFCDPGQSLVNRCHQQGIRVTATAFPHSISLALALSGFAHRSFWFQGFLPQKNPERNAALKQVWSNASTQVLMETPYRRQKLLEELLQARGERQKSRRLFMALELNGEHEKLLQGELEELISQTHELPKLEFVLVIDQGR